MKTYDRKSFQRRDGSTIRHAIPQRFRVALYDNACPENGWLAYGTRKLYYFSSVSAATDFAESFAVRDYGGFSIFDRTTRRYIIRDATSKHRSVRR